MSAAPDQPSAREDRTASKLRLFVALDLPSDRRKAIHAWAERELAAEGLRVVRPESLHLTLAFLGHHPAEASERAGEIVTGLAPRPVRLRPQAELVPIPARRPRLVALGLEAPDAVRIQAELARALVAAGVLEPDQRPFWPHVTLVRARGGRHERAARRALGRPLPELPGGLREPFGAVRLRLYRSLLRPDGSQYVSLANLDLPPAATEPEAE
jgi:RNA 2',3'-cyclic 3'-phosphodiesterase